MRLLLDTHTLLWWHDDPDNLSESALSAILEKSNAVYLSVVNAWEMQIKSQLGKLSVPGSIKEVVDTELDGNGFQLLTVTLPHIYSLKELPFYHKDPFDRLLIAQARYEGLEFVTNDKDLEPYDVPVLW